MYFALMLDRTTGGPVLLASSQGGVDIEEVARENPVAILSEPIDFDKGLLQEQAMKLTKAVGFSPPCAQQVSYLPSSLRSASSFLLSPPFIFLPSFFCYSFLLLIPNIRNRFPLFNPDFLYFYKSNRDFSYFSEIQCDLPHFPEIIYQF